MTNIMPNEIEEIFEKAGIVIASILATGVALWVSYKIIIALYSAIP